MSNSWKVAVVGAGPAGCAAARSLASAQIEVVLLEGGYPGKDKPCGDAFLPSAIALLGQLGIDDACITALGGYPFEHIDFWGRDSLLWSTKKAVGGTGWVIPRATLDQKLRDLTSHHVELDYGARVVDLTAPDMMAKDGPPLLLSVRQNGLNRTSAYDAVILASGSGDPLSQKWGTSGQPLMGASISCYLSRPTPRAPLFQFRDELRPGYGWIFPAGPESVNLGVCSLAHANNKKLRRLADQYLAAWEIAPPVKWRGGGGPLWSGNGTRWHHPSGIVSCGDAAGVVDPMNGEGITAALLSGMHAGAAVARYLQEGRSVACLEEYSSWVSTHFSRKYHRNPLQRMWGQLCGF